MSRELTEYTAVIIEKSAERWLVECGRCGGSGRNNTYECDVCSGNGKVWLSVDPSISDPGLFQCGKCSGSGSKNTYTCDGCDGVGVFVGESPRTECPRCGGSGTKNTYTCSNCDGVGSIPTDDLETY
jgi:DnaJ-class molecular chaperone